MRSVDGHPEFEFLYSRGVIQLRLIFDASQNIKHIYLYLPRPRFNSRTMLGRDTEHLELLSRRLTRIVLSLKKYADQ